MARIPRTSARRLPDNVRRRVEVATAMAWENLVATHVLHAGHFIHLFAESLPLEEALARYLIEMDIGDGMAAAVRTRVLVAIEESTRGGDPDAVALRSRQEEAPDEVEGWRRFRPDIVVRELVQRQRREDEVEAWVRLAIARAEEAIINTHVDSAITFAALLEEFLPLDRAVHHYLAAANLAGARAQTIHQRTMARLADVHLPLPQPQPPAAEHSADASG
jgi:hypothetical protein